MHAVNRAAIPMLRLIGSMLMLVPQGSSFGLFSALVSRLDLSHELSTNREQRSCFRCKAHLSVGKSEWMERCAVILEIPSIK